MTQIILVLSHEYVLMASDRRLTYLDEKKGNSGVLTDDECKLVALCFHSAIAYTGLARLDGMPTHRWIASILKKYSCIDGTVAANIIMNEAGIALEKIRAGSNIKHTTFLIAGYQPTQSGTIVPYCIRVSNAYGKDGLYLQNADNQFTVKISGMPKDDSFGITVIGEPMNRSQIKRVDRLLKKVNKNGNPPSAALRVIKDEIIVSSNTKETVGKKILGMCLTKKAVELGLLRGTHFLMGNQPIDPKHSTFTYFEEGYNRMIQYGPTYVCGDSAHTDFALEQTENTISAKFRLL